MKIVLFGDSLFANMSKRHVLKIEKQIPGSDAYNCAVGGWDSNDCVAKGPYIAKLEPDVLIISLGTNDASSWKLVELEKFKENVNKIIDIFKGSKFIYFLPPPSDETKHAPDRVRKNETTKQYHDAAKSICGEKGALTINSWDIFKPMLDRGEVYHVEDGTHLEENAYDIIIAKIVTLLTPETSTGLTP